MARKKKNEKETVFQLGEIGQAILSELITGTDSVTDRTIKTAFASYVEKAAEADKEMKQSGMVQTFPNGTEQVSPHWTIFRTAVSELRALYKEMRLSEAVATDEPAVVKSLDHLMPIRKAE